MCVLCAVGGGIVVVVDGDYGASVVGVVVGGCGGAVVVDGVDDEGGVGVCSGRCVGVVVIGVAICCGCFSIVHVNGVARLVGLRL